MSNNLPRDDARYQATQLDPESKVKKSKQWDETENIEVIWKFWR